MKQHEGQETNPLVMLACIGEYYLNTRPISQQEDNASLSCLAPEAKKKKKKQLKLSPLLLNAASFNICV